MGAYLRVRTIGAGGGMPLHTASLGPWRSNDVP